MEWSDVPSCCKDVWKLIERSEKDAIKKLKRCVEDVLKIPGFVYRVINLSIQQADEQINENHSHVSHGCVWTCV